MSLFSLTQRWTGTKGERRSSSQLRPCCVDFTSSPSSSKLCLLTAEDSDEKRDYRTLALPFYTQWMICCLTVVFLLEKVYTLPKAHFMEQLTRSKHPINEHDTKQNRARLMLSFSIQTAEGFLTALHTFTEINMYCETSQTLHFLLFFLAWKYFHVSKYKAKVM